MKRARFLGVTVLVVFLMVPILAAAATAFGQEMSDQDKKMMDQMMKYGTPGKSHELLRKYVGEWDVDMTMWPKPGAEPMKSHGVLKNDLILEGRFVECRFESLMMGMKFTGLEIIGYDLFRQTYVTFWIDSLSTAFLMTTGKLDSSGKILTDTGEYPDAVTDGKTMQKVRNVTTFLEDGKIKFEMFMSLPDGRPFKSMEYIASRKM